MFAKTTRGDHAVYKYTNKFEQFFIGLFSDELRECKSLDQLHTESQTFKDYEADPQSLNDVETDLHKKFYAKIKNDDEFKKLYCETIAQIRETFFPEEEYLIYQSFPSVRFQFPGGMATPAHFDADHIGKHPIGEHNFIVPITEMKNTCTLWVESTPNAKDFEPVHLLPGEIYKFNGNTCTHYNKPNQEKMVRISMDFRVMTSLDYYNYITAHGLTTTNPRDPSKSRAPTKMCIGGYYQVMQNNDSMEQMCDWATPKPLMQSRPVFGEEEAVAVSEYIKSGGFLTEFKKTTEFEKALAKFIGVKHVIMFNSCTSALTAAVYQLINDYCKYSEDEDARVIVPSYSMIATANAVYASTEDIEFAGVSKWGTLTLASLKESVTDDTRVVVYVSLNNDSSELKEIAAFCKEKNIILIEDAAQSLGCTRSGKHLGTFGDIGCFSLSTPKIISTGQGGFAVTDNDEYAEKLRQFKNFGRAESGRDDYISFGGNTKFTDLQAVVGLEQLKKLGDRVEHLKTLQEEYLKIGSSDGVFGIGKVYCDTTNPEWFPWFVTSMFRTEKIRDQVGDFLNFHDVQTRMPYPVITDTPVYKNQYPGHFHENASRVSKKTLFFPTHQLVTINDVQFIGKLMGVFDYAVDKILDQKYYCRKLRDDDYKEFKSVIQQFRPTEFTEKQFVETLKNVNVIVAVDEFCHIVGAATLQLEQKFIYNLSKTMRIEDVIVDVNVRNQGVGKMLLTEAIRQSRKAGCYKITLSCNDDVIPFYRSVGFESRGNNMSLVFN